MADIADVANDNLESEIKRALSLINSSEVAKANGACLYCNEPLSLPRRWCDADCRDNWEKEQKNGTRR